MEYHIEGAKYKYGKVILVGWAKGAAVDDYVEASVTGRDSKVVPCTVDRRRRPDIRELFFGGKGEGLYGFRLCFEAKEEEVYRLALSVGRESKRITFTPLYIESYGNLPPKGFRERIKRRVYGKRKKEEKKKPPAGGALRKTPLISVVVPAYRTNPDHLREMIDSVLAQTYPAFELCLADGSGEGEASLVAKTIASWYAGEPKIRLNILSENKGISGNTNEALKMAKGEWIAMLDHDDVLEPEALYEVVKLLNENPALDFIYTDSDLTDEDNIACYNPLKKPGWSPEMMYSANYITHFSVIRKEILETIGGWKPEFDGAQDWDLFFRVSEATKNIGNVSRVLYHWRAAATSTANAVETKPYAAKAQLLAITEQLKRTGRKGTVYFADTALHCIRVQLEKTGREVLFFCDSRCKELSPEAKEELESWASQPGIGLVMPRLMQPDGRIYSEGYQYFAGEKPLYQGRTTDATDEYGTANWYRNIDVPETVCLAAARDVVEAYGSPLEGDLSEYCERLKAEGLRNLMTPFAEVTVLNNE